MKKTKKQNLGWSIVLSLAVAIFMSSCVSPQKLVERGDYDHAIQVAVKRLAGKKNKKVKYVQALELAFAKANAEDLAEADRLKKSARPENWERVLAIYEDIDYRQKRIQPLLPLIDKEGIKAGFKFVRVSALVDEAFNNTVEYYYQSGKKLLASAEATNNKYDAREAFNDFKKVKTYRRDYKDVTQLTQKATNLGTTHILFDVRNESSSLLPRDLVNDLKRINVRDLEGPWQMYHAGSTSNVEMDYRVVMNITDVDISPGFIKEREYEDTKEIIDGWEYVLDDRGNVMKDTLGNDIKVDKKVIISAQVIEVYQHKLASISARIDVLDEDRGELIDSHNLAVDAVFENYASTFQGDKRALSKDTKRRIGNHPVDFPQDNVLLYEAAEELKPAIRKRLSTMSL
jgi:hypothetical protein